MKRKGWFIPILVFFISISGLIFYQKQQDSPSFASTTNLPPILWSEAEANINKIEFSESGHKVQAVRASENWELSSPISSKADNFFIYNIILAFKEPVFTETIETDPAKLSDYGIDNLSPHLKLSTKDKDTYELIRGDLADTLHYYVYSPMSATIYTMPKSGFENIHTDLSMWRDKDLLTFNKKDITKLDITYNNTLYTTLPENQPLNTLFKSDVLDEKILNYLVDFLESCTIKEFITDTADSSLLPAYGFNAPSLKVKMTLNSGEILTFIMGISIKSENLCYAVINHSNSIVTIPYFDLSKLLKPKPIEVLPSKTPIVE